MSRPYIVLIRQLGGIGDVLSASCVMRGLSEKYPRHDLKLVTAELYLSGSLYDIARHNPYLKREHIHIIEPYEGTTQRTKEVWHKYFFEGPAIDDWPLLTGAAHVFDINVACVEYEHPALMTPEGIQKPRYQIWCEKAGVVPSSYKPAYKITPDELRWAKEEFGRRGWSDGKPCVAVSVGSCDPRRSMSVETLIDVCRGLEKRGLRAITIDTAWQQEGIPAIVGMKVSQVIAMLSRMSAAVCADSGLLHMAGAAGTPIVGVFGPTDPAMRMGPYLGSATLGSRLMPCAPCWYTYPCMNDPRPSKHLLCMKGINPDILVEEAFRWATSKRAALP